MNNVLIDIADSLKRIADKIAPRPKEDRLFGRPLEDFSHEAVVLATWGEFGLAQREYRKMTERKV